MAEEVLLLLLAGGRGTEMEAAAARPKINTDPRTWMDGMMGCSLV